MLVQNWMSRPVITIDADANMPKAAELLKKHKIHALPVIKKEKLVGLLTDSDLKRASASDATSLDAFELAYIIQKIKITQIMSAEPATITLDRTLSEAADLFLKHDVPVLPVMAGHAQLVGIISPSDISRAYLCLSAHGRKGIEIGMQVEDQPGATLALIESIGRHGARIGSVISIDSYAPEGCRHVYLRIYGVDSKQMTRLLPELKTGGRLLFFIDQERDAREIYAAS